METVSGGVVYFLAVHNGGMGDSAYRVRVLVPGTLSDVPPQTAAKSARGKCLTTCAGGIKI